MPCRLLAQRAVLDVAEAVVGHQPTRDDPMLREEGERPLDESGDGRGLLVGVELDVGEPRMVVDDRVREVVADPRFLPHPAATAMRAVAGDAVPGLAEAGVAACVHVKQVTGAGPLVAVGRLLDRRRTARETGPLEHLPDRRVRDPRRTRNQTRTPTGLAPAVADPLLQLSRQQPWREVRTARAIPQRSCLPTTVKPATPPAMRRRRRNTEGRRGRSHRAPTFDRAHKREPTCQSELGVSVQIHPRPPLSVSPGRPTASKEGRIEPQPFTTSVGGTTS